MYGRFLRLVGVAALSVACGRDSELPPLPPDPRTVKPQQVLASPPTDPMDAHRRTLLEASVAARLRWQALAPSAYRLIVSQRCRCDAGTPFKSDVRDGLVVSRRGGVRSDERPVQPPLRTVEQLFAQALRAIDGGADDVTVDFDPALGYPSRIRIDPRRNVADDEREWVATLSVTRAAPLTVLEVAK